MPTLARYILAGAALVAVLPAAAEQAVLERQRWWEQLTGDEPVQLGSWRMYRKDGLRFDNERLSTRLKLNATLFGDAGDAWLDDTLASAFPGADGGHAKITQARLTLQGWLFDQGKFKAQLEFAQQVQMKDMWWQFNPLPYVGTVTIGNMQEPFSLAATGSSLHRTFMVEALPALAFAPGLNIGVMAQDTALDNHLSWALGGFWNTGSFSNIAGAKDSFSNANGFHLTGRVTYLPVWRDAGRELTHLGVSLSLQTFTAETVVRAVPETSLFEQYFVDTGLFQPERATALVLEYGRVEGPWSVQAEATLYKLQAPALGDPLLSGAYILGSHVLTGEHRLYDRFAGVFDTIIPRHNFSLHGAGWGAFEVALQLSTVDLNDGALAGGRQRDLSLGLNWYLNPQARLMFNYVHARVSARNNPPALDDSRAGIFQARLQYAF